ADPHRPDVEVLTAAPSRRDSVQGELTVSHPSDVGYEELEQSDVVIEDVGLGDGEERMGPTVLSTGRTVRVVLFLGLRSLGERQRRARERRDSTKPSEERAIPR